MSTKRWRYAKVIAIEELCKGVIKILMETTDQSIVDFIPGQYVTMDLPTGTKRLDRWRSYSLANALTGSSSMEFCISYFPNGLASEYFFNVVKVGTTIKFKGPAGNFVLPKTLDFDCVMICTGTGIAPFRSMIKNISQKLIKHKNIHLIYGTRYHSGLLYHQEMKQYELEMDNFEYSIALSREFYKGYKGYVHDIYMSKANTYNEHTQFFICGWKNMIDDAIQNLTNKLHIPQTSIHYELYG